MSAIVAILADQRGMTITVYGLPTHNALRAQPREELMVQHGPTYGHSMRALETALHGVAYAHGGISTCGLAVTGVPDSRRNFLLTSAIPEWEMRELRVWLEAMEPLQTTTIVEFGSLAEGRALAEAKLNPKLRDTDFLLVDLGYTVEIMRLAIVEDSMFTFPSNAGHLLAAGHGALDWSNPAVCFCGQFDCISNLCGLAAIESRFRCQKVKRLPPSQLNNVALHAAYGIRTALVAMPETTVVLGGELLGMHPSLLDRVGEHLRRLHQAFPVELVAAEATAAPGLGVLYRGTTAH